MTRGDRFPCGKCGTSDWTKNGSCKQCARDRAAQWQRDNPDRRLENSRRWQRANPDKTRESTKEWRRRNPEKSSASYNRRRTRKTKAGGSYTVEEFKALCKQYDGRCACCGKKKRLTPDHVIPVALGGSSDIVNIQPLCQPCNSRKGTDTTDYRTKPGILRWIQESLFN